MKLFIVCCCCCWLLSFVVRGFSSTARHLPVLAPPSLLGSSNSSNCVQRNNDERVELFARSLSLSSRADSSNKTLADDAGLLLVRLRVGVVSGILSERLLVPSNKWAKPMLVVGLLIRSVACVTPDGISRRLSVLLVVVGELGV